MTTKFPELHLACRTDDLRPVMCHVVINKKYTAATNAHILAYFPTSELFPEDFVKNLPRGDFFIHREDWAKFKGCENIEWHDKKTIKVSYPKKRPQIFEIVTQKLLGAKYPKWEVVVPELAGLKPQPLKEIGLNPVLLANLNKVLGSPVAGLRLTLYAANKAIGVSARENNGKGIIMPVMNND